MSALVLAIRLWSTWPDLVDPAQALAHVRAAQAAATPTLPAELLLGMAYVESRFQPDAVSRVRGSVFCGAIQARARTRRHPRYPTCAELADLPTAYAAGVAEIERWLVRTKGNVNRALAGHGCGNRGLVTGCRRYAARVRYRASQLTGGTHTATTHLIKTSS